MEPQPVNRTPRIAAALALLAVVALAVWLIVAQLTTEPEPKSQPEPAHQSLDAGQTCTSCKAPDHNYQHLPPFDGPACERCHNLESWRQVFYTHGDANFNVSFHAVVGCTWCHTVAEPMPSPACATCHLERSPHGKSPLACGMCHTAEAWPLLRPLPEDHLSLDGGHEAVSCFECHKTAPLPDAPPRECVDCHKSHHGGLTACEECHEPARGWKPLPGFDHSAFFSLQGAHATVACASCHRNNRFAGTSSDCVDCHGTHHNGLTDCGACHTPVTGWKALPGFDHDVFFTLSGKHTQVECGSCHVNGKLAGTPTYCSGCHDVEHTGLTACEQCHTTSGFVPSTFNHSAHFRITGQHTSATCSQCHKNGKYNGTPTYCSGCHRVEHPGLTRCQDCHTTSGFVPSTFNHSVHFKIDGQHTKLDCSDCHPTGTYNGTPTDCGGCHGTRHGGLSNCDDCHTTAGFLPTTFVHADVFPLEGVHATLTCDKCHPSYEFASNIGGGDEECSNCHALRHGAAYTSCTSCHTTAGWTPTKAITHPAPIELGPDHQSRSCSLCHPTLLWAAPPTVCEQCHLPNVPHVGPTDCLRCHRPTTWAEVHFTHPELGIHADNNVNSQCLWCHPGPDFTKWDCKVCHEEGGIPMEDPTP